MTNETYIGLNETYIGFNEQKVTDNRCQGVQQVANSCATMQTYGRDKFAADIAVNTGGMVFSLMFIGQRSQ